MEKKNGFDNTEPEFFDEDDDLEEEDAFLSQEELDDLDDQLDVFAQIVPYEQLCNLVARAFSRSPLRMTSYENMLNVVSLDREFRLEAALRNERIFEPMYADDDPTLEVTLNWEAANTILSLYGHEGMCSVYHNPDEWCNHQDMGASPLAEITLEYHVPSTAILDIHDDEDIDHLAEQLRSIFSGDRGETGGELPDMSITFQAVHARGELRLTEAAVRYEILLEDELIDTGLLHNIVTDLAQEAASNLKKLAAAYPPQRKK